MAAARRVFCPHIGDVVGRPDPLGFARRLLQDQQMLAGPARTVAHAEAALVPRDSCRQCRTPNRATTRGRPCTGGTCPPTGKDGRWGSTPCSARARSRGSRPSSAAARRAFWRARCPRCHRRGGRERRDIAGRETRRERRSPEAPRETPHRPCGYARSAAGRCVSRKRAGPRRGTPRKPTAPPPRGESAPRALRRRRRAPRGPARTRSRRRARADRRRSVVEAQKLEVVLAERDVAERFVVEMAKECGW